MTAPHYTADGENQQEQVKALTAEVTRLRSLLDAHEITCPACGATIRARMADQP